MIQIYRRSIRASFHSECREACPSADSLELTTKTEDEKYKLLQQGFINRFRKSLMFKINKREKDKTMLDILRHGSIANDST